MESLFCYQMLCGKCALRAGNVGQGWMIKGDATLLTLDWFCFFCEGGVMLVHGNFELSDNRGGYG